MVRPAAELSWWVAGTPLEVAADRLLAGAEVLHTAVAAGKKDKLEVGAVAENNTEKTVRVV